MTHPDESCPDDDVLHALLDGSDKGNLDDGILHHLSSCDHCVRRLEQLARCDFPSMPAMNDAWPSSPPGVSSPSSSWLEHVRALVAKSRPVSNEHGTSQPSGRRDGPRRSSATVERLLGHTVGDYQIVRVLGRGGMGTVYRAKDLRLDRDVAIKRISPRLKTACSNTVLREARAGAKIRHPNVVAVYGVQTIEDDTLIVMEYVEGPSLAQLIRQRGRLEPRTAARLVAQVAGGLAAAHQRGLIHRDIKPGNILLDPRLGIAKLGDFGLAIQADTDSRAGHSPGTPGYIAPELMTGDVVANPQTDIFALGVTLWEALTGQPPETSLGGRKSERSADDATVVDLPIELRAICRKATDADYRRRYANVDALANDIRNWLDDRATMAMPDNWYRYAHRCLRHHRWRFVTLGLLLVALAVPLVWQGHQTGQLETWMQRARQYHRQVREADQTIDQIRQASKRTSGELAQTRAELDNIQRQTIANAFRLLTDAVPPEQPLDAADAESILGGLFYDALNTQLAEFEGQLAVESDWTAFFQAQGEYSAKSYFEICLAAGESCLLTRKKRTALETFQRAEALVRRARAFNPELTPTDVSYLRCLRHAAEIALELDQYAMAKQRVRQGLELCRLIQGASPPTIDMQEVAFEQTKLKLCRANLASYSGKQEIAVERIRELVPVTRSAVSDWHLTPELRLELVHELAMAHVRASQHPQALDALQWARRLSDGDAIQSADVGTGRTEKGSFDLKLVGQWERLAERLVAMQAYRAAEIATEQTVCMLERLASDSADPYVEQCLKRAQLRLAQFGR